MTALGAVLRFREIRSNRRDVVCPYLHRPVPEKRADGLQILDTITNCLDRHNDWHAKE
jgi:hypothetical protein